MSVNMLLLTDISSAVPIGINLKHCPIQNPKYPIVCSKPGNNVQWKTNSGGQCQIVSESIGHPQNKWCEYFFLIG